MSKTLSILFLVLSSLSFNWIIGFSIIMPNPDACVGWTIFGAIIALSFSITALAKSYKTKSIQKTMSVIGIVFSSICFYFIFNLLSFIEDLTVNDVFIDSHNWEAISGWGMLSMLYAIPFAIVLLVKGKPGHEN
jgi:hypothetical protein